MELLKQKDRGQCLITAHAMCMGISVDSVIAGIGHDGMERIHPTLEEPFCFRGFHEQEIIDHAFELGTWVIKIEALPGAISGGEQEELYVVKFKDSNEDRIFRYLNNSERTIILGRSTRTDVWHAVAWDGKQIYDPNGKVYSILNAADEGFGDVTGLLIYKNCP